VKTAIQTDTPEKERIEQERADNLDKEKKQPNGRPIRKELESCSEEDEQNYKVPLKTDSNSPFEAEAEEQDVADVEERVFVVVKYEGKRSIIGFVGKVVGRDEKTAQGTLSKPSQPNISAMESEQIVKVLGAPVSTGTTVRTLGCVSFGNKLDGGFESR